MKLLKLLFFVLIIAMLAGMKSYSQDDDKIPFQDFGVGFSINEFSGDMNSQTFGINGVYALSREFHIGTHLGFFVQGGDRFTSMQTYISFAPFARFYLMKMRNFRLFGQGAIVISSEPVWEKGVSQEGGQWTMKTLNGLQISGGGEWYPYSSVGVYGGFEIFGMNITSPLEFRFGIGRAYLGAEWFIM